MEDKRQTVNPLVLADVSGRLRTARAILEMVAMEMSTENMTFAGDVLEAANTVKDLQYKIND